MRNFSPFKGNLMSINDMNAMTRIATISAVLRGGMNPG